MRPTGCILFLALLALCSCSGDGDTGTGDAQDLPVASAGIGTRGGTLETEGFLLTVPPGAFADSVTLNLYMPDDDQAFQDLPVTPTYKVAGLPDEFSKPLSFALEAGREVEDSVAVAVVTDISPICGDEEQAVYNIVGAKDSLGHIVFELPVPVSGPLNSFSDSRRGRLGDDKALQFFGIDKTESFNGRLGEFKFSYPKYVESYMDEIEDYFILAHIAGNTMGFETGGLHKRFGSRMLVMVTDKVGNYDFYVTIAYPRWWYACFVINANRLSLATTEELRCRIAYMYFVALGTTYDTWLYAYQDWSNLWFHHAVGTWAQELVVYDDEFRPYGFEGHEMAPFNGIQAGGGSTPQSRIDHGIGMASMMRYLVNLHGQSQVIRLYKGLFNGQLAVEAIKDTLGLPYSSWYDDFYRSYLAHDGVDHLYDVPSEIFLEHKAGTFSTASDTARTFPGSYPPLSAKVYFVELNDAQIDTNATIKFTAECPELETEHVQISVFGLHNTNLRMLGSGNPCQIADIRAKTLLGYDLVALPIISAYDPSSAKRYSVALTIREVPAVSYNNFSFDLEELDVLLKLAGGQEEWATWYYDIDGEGTMDGNKFTMVEDYYTSSQPPDHIKRSVEFIFDLETYAITEYTIIDSTMNQLSGVVVGTTIKGNYIFPTVKVETPHPVLRYDITGSSVCSAISSYEYEGTYPPAHNEMLDYECDSNTTLEIVFWKW